MIGTVWQQRESWTEPAASGTLLVTGLFALFAALVPSSLGSLVPWAFLVAAPALIVVIARHARSGRLTMGRTSRLFVYSLTAYLIIAAVIMLLTVPIAGKGPSGTGLTDGSLQLFSVGTALLSPLYGTLVLASTFLFWKRWSLPFRIIASAGAVLVTPFFITFVPVLDAFTTATAWRQFVQVTAYPGIVLLVVAHARLWVRTRQGSDDVADAVDVPVA